MFQTHLCHTSGLPAAPRASFSASPVIVVGPLFLCCPVENDTCLSRFTYFSSHSRVFPVFLSHLATAPQPLASHPCRALSLSLRLLSRHHRALWLSPSSSSLHARVTPLPGRVGRSARPRIDLTLAVADYKSDQLGAHRARWT